MNVIQLKNFRRFPDDQFYKIPFKDITILVGKNNSGKSTMVKALLLILEYLKSDSVANFDFANKNLENTNIVTFGRAKNKHSHNNTISFALTFEGFTIELDITGEDDDTSCQVKFVRISAHESDNVSMGYLHEFTILPKERKVIFSRSKVSMPKKFTAITSEKDEELQKEIEKIKTQINLLKEDLPTLEKSSKEFIEKNQTLKKIEDNIKVLRRYLDKKEDIQKDEYRFELDYLNDNSIENILSETSDNAARMTKERVKKITGKHARSANEPFSDYMAFKSQNSNVNSLLDYIFKSIKDLNIYYLPSNPAKQSALFRIKDKQNALAQSIHEYYQIVSKFKSGETYRFVKEWMDNDNGFEIGEDLEIIFRASEAYEVNIIERDKGIPLADKGMGSIQAMLLIMRIAVIIEKTQKEKYTPLVVIEEPELNLHPKLQSRLCDFFLQVHEKYNIKFIIESHSEYLIRKSQIWVKKREYQHETNSNPFSISYFDKTWDNIYQMIYRQDGIFENEFGEGFYDESAKMTIEML